MQLRASILALLMAGAALAQHPDLRPPEPSPSPPPPRKTTVPSISPQREAVWLFEEAKRLHHDGSLVRAVDVYRKALARDPARLEYRPFLAMALDELGKYEEAKEQFDLYLKLEPNDLRIRLQRIATLIHNAEYAEATRELEALKLYGAGSPVYHDMVGLLALHLHNFPEAVSAYQTVLSQDASRVDARIHLAQAYLLLGQPDKAREQLELALKNGPKKVVLNNLGVLKAQGGEFQEAQKLFEESSSDTPPGSAVNEALLNLATVLAQQAKDRDALLTVSKLLDLQSDNLDARILYACLLARADRLPEARKEIDKLFEMGPQVLGVRWAYVCEVCGFIALRMDDTDGARVALEKAVQALPKSVSARHNLAMVLGRMGSLDEAIAHERQASEMAPDNKAVWYHLGVLYDLDARPKLAVEAYKKFLQLAPQDPEAAGLKEHVQELQQILDGTVGQPLR